MRILFLTHYFPPESNAPAVRTFEHCRFWVEQGHEVHVLTGYPSHPGGVRYPGWGRKAPRSEVVEGIHVHRVWTYLAANVGFVKRTLNYVSYILPSLWRSLRLRRPDVVVATSPQFFCGLTGALVARAKRRPWVLEIRDLWPESIEAVGAVTSPTLLAPFYGLARWLYRDADRVVCLTNAFVESIHGEGIPRSKLHFVPNGVDMRVWGHVEPAAWRQRLTSSTSDAIVGYVGTMGMAHGLEVVLEAAEQLVEAEAPVRFVMAGGGADEGRLRALATEAGLSNVTFLGQVPREEVPDLLAALDIALVPLRDKPLFETVLPSKMFEAMATGTPIVMGVRGEALAVLERSGGGVCVPPEDGEALAAAIGSLLQDRSRRELLGRNARAFVAREFNRHTLASELLETLEAVRMERPRRSSSPIVLDACWAGDKSLEFVGGRQLRELSKGTPCVRAVSIVVPVRNEAGHMDRFIRSVAAMDCGDRAVELLLVEGASRDGTYQALKGAVLRLREVHQHWRIELLRNPTGTIPESLNVGIRASTGDAIVRLDAHSLFPPTYVRDLLDTLVDTGAANVGGVVRAIPGGTSPISRAIPQARSDLLGAGRSPFRTGRASGPQRTVPFGCFLRSTLESCGLFDVRLKRNQDLELNHRIRKHGGLIFQNGAVVSEHIAPATALSLFRKHFANGQWNIYATLVSPGCVSWMHFVPGVALAALMVSFLLAWEVGLLLVVTTICTNLWRARVIRDEVPSWAIGASFCLIQLGHGLGQLWGSATGLFFLLSERRRGVSPLPARDESARSEQLSSTRE